MSSGPTAVELAAADQVLLDNGPIGTAEAAPTISDEDAEAIRASMGDVNQQARLLMVGIDPLLRKLPYEQRTATLLNLLVTYAAELPAAQERRGKFINAMTEEFRKRLQRYLPLMLG